MAPRGVHAVDRMLSLLDALGIPPEPADFGPEKLFRGEPAGGAESASRSSSSIPGPAGPTSVYPPERWGEAARRLRDATGLATWIAAARGEERLAAGVEASAAGAAQVVAAGDLPTLAALIRAGPPGAGRRHRAPPTSPRPSARRCSWSWDPPIRSATAPTARRSGRSESGCHAASATGVSARPRPACWTSPPPGWRTRRRKLLNSRAIGLTPFHRNTGALDSGAPPLTGMAAVARRFAWHHHRKPLPANLPASPTSWASCWSGATGSTRPSSRKPSPCRRSRGAGSAPTSSSSGT